MDLSLRDSVFVVTGASRGLGLASARELVREGARVVLLARASDALDSAAAELGDRAEPLADDLADPLAAERAVTRALERFGRLDGALLSVGGPPAGTVLTTSDEQWRTAFDTVFLGAVRASRAVCAGLAQSTGTGALAWVLSTSAVEVFPGLTTSNGLRPGLAMLVKDLADEVGPRGIRINGLLPGRIATDRLAALDAATGDPEAARARAAARIPLGRYGEPEEFGRVAAFLLSPAASYVTGTLIAVDGGVTRSP